MYLLGYGITNYTGATAFLRIIARSSTCNFRTMLAAWQSHVCAATFRSILLSFYSCIGGLDKTVKLLYNSLISYNGTSMKVKIGSKFSKHTRNNLARVPSICSNRLAANEISEVTLSGIPAETSQFSFQYLI